MAEALLMDNPFWEFSCQVYSVGRVASDCLDLQRRNSVDVNVLLFACWMGVAQRIRLNYVQMNSIEKAVEQWNSAVVQRLRGVRDLLKSAEDSEQASVKDFRRRVLAIELGAEQIEQAILFRWFQRRDFEPHAAPVRDTLVSNLLLFSKIAPDSLIDASLAIIGTRSP